MPYSKLRFSLNPLAAHTNTYLLSYHSSLPNDLSSSMFNHCCWNITNGYDSDTQELEGSNVPHAMSSGHNCLRPCVLVGSRADNRSAPSQTSTVANDNEPGGSRHALKISIDMAISLHLEAAVRQIEVEGVGFTHDTQSQPATSVETRLMAASLDEQSYHEDTSLGLFNAKVFAAGPMSENRNICAYTG